MKKIITNILALTILVPTLFVSCNNDDGVDPGTAPEIPPLATFLMNFDIVNADQGGRVDAGSNWAYSALNVGIWNTILTVTFAVPVASFAESFNHDPVFNASIPGWTWEYSHTALAATYHARLQAEITDTAIEWDMFVTREGAFTDFNWYSGTSSLDGLSGTWTLNHNPDAPEPFIDIEWSRDSSGELMSIGYTNVIPDGDSNGSFIYFQRDPNDDFDRGYNIYSIVEDNLTEIQWNSDTQDGRVRDLLHFGDNEYHCWDEMLEDIDCPS